MIKLRQWLWGLVSVGLLLFFVRNLVVMDGNIVLGICAMVNVLFTGKFWIDAIMDDWFSNGI